MSSWIHEPHQKVSSELLFTALTTSVKKGSKILRCAPYLLPVFIVEIGFHGDQHAAAINLDLHRLKIRALHLAQDFRRLG